MAPACLRVGAFLSSLLLLLSITPCRAQQPDSTQRPPLDSARTVLPDSARDAAPDSARAETGPLLNLAAPLPGARLHRRRPARRVALRATDLLGEAPGSFVYGFGTPGWPDGWSTRGMSPQRVSLRWNDLPFDDPLTGRPRYDLLPLAFLQPLHVGTGAEGAPTGVYTRTMPYEYARPQTELRYRTGSGGLQSIMALHAQQRQIEPFGQRARLQVVAGYGGHAGGAAYSGSRLRRMRQTYLRLRYRQHGWAVQLSNLHNRRFLGAQGGVEPSGPLSTIYTVDPGLVPVRHENARRRTIRNDLRLAARARFVPGWTPPSAVLYWTTQIARYHPVVDSAFTARTSRYGLRLTQRLRIGPHRLRLRLDARRDWVREGNALPDSVIPPRSRLTLAARDSMMLGPIRTTLTAQLHAGADLPLVTGRLHARLPLGPIAAFLDVRRAGQPVSLTARGGFGPFLNGSDHLPTTHLHTGRLGVSGRWRALDATVTGFAQHIAHPWDYVATDPVEPQGLAYPAHVAVQASSASLQRVGLALDLGLRRRAKRGFYLTAQPSFVQPLTPNASPLTQRLAASHPHLFGRAQLGARYALFENDLDLDVYLEGRFWTTMRSRGLHPATALLVLLPGTARRFGPSGTLDLHVEANVRDATVFVSYENALSGTSLMPGTLIVPTYPLPPQHLRYGVFWPISG